jgi:urease accessory protein
VKVRNLMTVTALLAVPGISSAHSLCDIGAGGFAAGLSHPFTGLDHLLAMSGVGLWAASLGGAAVWKVPVSFVVMLMVGCALAMGGIVLPLVEPFIAASVLLLGLVLMLALRTSTAGGSLLVGLFALFHGHAHGAVLPAATSPWLYVLGMVSASMVLHLGGVSLGHVLRHSQWLLRAGGALLVGAGVWMIASA